MTRHTHYYSNTNANKKHDEVVGQLSGLLGKKEHVVSYPDKKQGQTEGIRHPDMAVNEVLAIEVKVLNPTNEDYKIDQIAQDEWEQNNRANYGGTMNPRPIKQDVEDAIKQFKNIKEDYKLLVLYSPLVWQLKHDKLAYMLLGLITLDLYCDKGDLIASRTRRTTVPLKRGVDAKIDGILYINEAKFENRKLWLLNDKGCDLLSHLCEDIEDFWKESTS